MAIQSVGNSGNPSPLPVAPQEAPVATAKNAEVNLQPSSVPQPNREQVQKAVESIKQLVQPMVSNNLDFSVEEGSGRMLVRITDSQTGELIRQIPSKELVESAHSLDRLQGLLLRQKA